MFDSCLSDLQHDGCASWVKFEGKILIKSENMYTIYSATSGVAMYSNVENIFIYLYIYIYIFFEN